MAAEETPGNLGSMFGGWMAGRASGNRRLDQSIDRLEDSVNKFADALAKLTATLNGTQSKMSGNAPAGSAQASGRSNGGGASFGGGMLGSVGGQQYQGMHSAGGTPQYPWSGTPNGGGGSHAGPGFFAQHGVTPGNVAKGTVAAGIAGTAIYTANHYSSQVTGQTLAAMYAGGPDWNAAYQSGFRDNYTAHGTADHWATISMMGQRAGYTPGSAGWNQVRQGVMSASAVNPMISNQQSFQADMSLGSTSSYNRLRGLGINPLGSAGQGDPRSVARQILSRMHADRVKTIANVAAAFAPAGSATVTLDAYEAHGFIDSKARPVIESEMRNILMAQVHGMNYSQYSANATAANTSSGARDALQGAGISTKSLVQKQYQSEGMSRESEGETIAGFTSGVSAATEAVNKFRGALNGILGLPGVGETVGLMSGSTGRLPIIGSLLNKLGGGGALTGVLGALSGGMASGGVLPGYSPGRDNHTFFSATGGTLRLSGGEGILIPQATRALGGPAGIKQINDRYRQSFADGGTFANPDAKTTMDGKSLSAIAASQIRLAEKIGGINLTIMQGGFGGSHIAASGTSHNYPGVVDVSPGTVAVERLLRRVGFAAWARNIPGRSRAGSGAHVHAVSLLDPGDKGSPQVYGSWAHNGNGLSGSNNDPAPHVPWLSGLRGLLGAGNLGSLGGGGGNMGGGSTGGGTSVGTAGATTAVGLGGGGGGGTGIDGSYSEVGALGLGGGSGGGGGVGVAIGGGTNSTSSMGGLGSVGGPGGPGNLSIGTQNMLFSNSNKQWRSDLNQATSKVDVLAVQEVSRRGAFLMHTLRRQGWDYYTVTGSNTGVAWNADKYRALQKGIFALPDSERRASAGGGHIKGTDCAYVLLQDKARGTKFWVVSVHPQAHIREGASFAARQRLQMQVLTGFTDRLRKTGIPVFIIGDFNNHHPHLSGYRDSAGYGIDRSLTSGATVTGQGHASAASDHPFVWANYNIGGGAHSGGGGGHGGSPAQNQALGRSMAASMGWSGQQWNALQTLWQHESGWRTNADNPTSSAYGIPQALTSLHHLAGTSYMTDPKSQIQWGLNYIKGRYGSPANAWNFWQKNHWYDVGEWNVSGTTDARVHKGEMILPSKVADVVRDELTSPGIRNILGGSRGGSGVQVNFQTGAIQINFPQGSVTKRGAEQAAGWVVDAMMEDRRMKALAEG
jgi:endonuclease/exonuclease/phosphatase family metal-dependent hydrolase